MKIQFKVFAAVIASVLQLISLPSMAEDSAAAIAATHARHLAFVAAPIKTPDDLREYLDSIGHRSSPLKKLSEAARKRFVDGLTFNELGVTSFNYSDIEPELTATQAYQLLALVGLQDMTSRLTGLKVISSLDREIMGKVTPTFATDYKDYKCASRATCESSLGNICTGNC